MKCMVVWQVEKRDLVDFTRSVNYMCTDSLFLFWVCVLFCLGAFLLTKYDATWVLFKYLKEILKQH